MTDFETTDYFRHRVLDPYQCCDYFFRATTDLDGDGVSCEAGDYCGAFPVLGEPRRVTVIAGSPTQSIDFVVSPSSSTTVSTAGR